MSLLQKLDQDIIKALKAGEKQKLTVLRGLKSAVKYAQIDGKKELTDNDVIAVLGSQAKKIRDAMEQFAKGGREDLVNQSKFELEVIGGYLPEQMSEDELRKLIEEAIAETGADSPQKVGLVMKAVMRKLKGRADGKQVNKLAMEILAK